MDTPTSEPLEITAGDTVRWQRSLADYPASSGWVLSYTLVNSAHKISITASASGDDHLVTVAKATTAAWVAGRYDWQAVVTSSTERYAIGTGTIVILPNFAAATSSYDSRSPARRILDALMAAYESYIASRGHVAEYDIAGRRMKFRSAEELLLQMNHWKKEVAREEQAAAIAAGRRPGKVFVRFDK